MITQVLRAGLGVLFAAVAACAVTPDPADYEGATVYTGAKVWGDGEFSARSFTVRDGVFIEPPRSRVETATYVDLTGRYVVPPFGEGHTHKIEGVFAFERFNEQFFRQGVFYAQNPAGLPRLMKQARKLTDAPDTIDVKYAMGGITTPFGHPERGYIEFMTKYAYRGETRESLRDTGVHAVKTVEDVQQAIDILVADEADFVKVFLQFSEEYDERSARLEAAGADLTATGIESTTGMDPSLVPAVVEFAHAAGLPVKAHVTTAHDFRVAVAAGVDDILHMPGPFLYGQETTDPFRLTAVDAQRAAEKGIAVVATAAVRLSMIDDADRPRVYALHRQNVRTLLDNGVPVLIGIDNYGETTRTEIDHLRAIRAMTDRELLNAWIATGPRIFPERKIGRVQPGYEASFLVLDADPLDDFTTLDRIASRVKEGLTIEVPEAAAE